MKAYFIPGFLGLLVGLLLHWAGLDHPAGLRAALSLRRGTSPRAVPLRSALAALGYAIAGTALLMWLAVLDTDQLIALPVNGRILAGGALFGLGAALCGFTPTTAFAGLSAAPLEALCTLAGLALTTAFLPEGEAVQADVPAFFSLGCAGLLAAAIALCIPNPRHASAAPETAEISDATPDAVPEADAAEASPADAPENEAAPEPPFVALLEGEEPLVVDTLSPADDTPPEGPAPHDESGDSTDDDAQD